VSVLTRERRGAPAPGPSSGPTAADLLAALALSADGRAELREVEAQLDRLIDEAVCFGPPAKLEHEPDGSALDAAAEVVEKRREEPDDDFDPAYERK
jgi:hypothetical protein